jgi:enamine deaminase RidA (YjgF/YER057c/UK114 family)
MGGSENSAERRLTELGIELPPTGKARGLYTPGIFDGNLFYLSGKGPRLPDGSIRTGKVGADISIEEAKEDAYVTGINLLSVLREELGSLDRVQQLIKVFAMVNAVPEFSQHPQVIDSFSQLMFDVFNEAGRHARSAIGVGSLPNNMSVEIEMIVRVKP